MLYLTLYSLETCISLALKGGHTSGGFKFEFKIFEYFNFYNLKLVSPIFNSLNCKSPKLILSTKKHTYRKKDINNYNY